jgi:alkanesulfonate monooxygenase SsuD/methylene tetrahydromethanopterin reductase-like flavin-dependent oxidoreductase (luciferase family)
MKIGLVLMLEGSPTAPRYTEVRALALRAEAAGFDSLWLYDHLLFRSDDQVVGQWECFTFLAGLADATQRIALGTLVACTAFRNPAVLAKIATALDEVSDGRFTLGLGAGWNEPEFRAFGLPFDHRVDRFEEALRIITPLLRLGQVDFTGVYSQAPNCVDTPRGPRPGGPPILIGAFGPRMTRLSAQYADSINTGVNLEQPERQRAELDALCAEFGRAPGSLALNTPLWAAFPELGPIPDHMNESVYHSAAELVERLHALARAGVDEVMIDFRPNSAATLDLVIEALALYRAAGSTTSADG